MATFDELFLPCKSAGFRPSDLFFSSGPAQILEPFSSVMVGSIVEYQATEIAAAIAVVPGTVLQRETQAESVWRWEEKGRFIEARVGGENTAEGGVWLASPVSLDCTFSDLVTFWLTLAGSHPAVYLHDQPCRMYTPCSFLEERAVWALRGAFRTGDSTTRALAMRASRHYLALHGRPRLWQRHWQEKTPHMRKTLFDLPPPVVPVKCKDSWLGKNWQSRMAEFDHEAHARDLAYFAYPTAESVGGKYTSGFLVWVTEEQAAVASELADSLGVLGDGA